jgi:gliding motility-associated lipoprotein GldD
MTKTKIKLLCFFIISALFIYACGNNETYTPKPIGHFRIALPEKEYQRFDSSSFPYAFEYPVYADIVFEQSPGAKKYWLNINYPDYLAQISLTYLPVINNVDTLYKYTEDSYNFVSKHIPMANDIEPDLIRDTLNNVYGLKYNIEGNAAASPFQFFVTDSCQHFIRASMHFYVSPNNDSLSPVIDFIKADMDHLIKTIEWR